LEKWTVGLFGMSWAILIFGLVGGFVCMCFSKYWTLNEKLFAAIVPTGAGLFFGAALVSITPMAGGGFFVVIFLIICIAQVGAAVYLADRGRDESASETAAN
jgi:hypothetical protein